MINNRMALQKSQTNSFTMFITTGHLLHTFTPHLLAFGGKKRFHLAGGNDHRAFSLIALHRSPPVMILRHPFDLNPMYQRVLRAYLTK